LIGSAPISSPFDLGTSERQPSGVHRPVAAFAIPLLLFASASVGVAQEQAIAIADTAATVDTADTAGATATTDETVTTDETETADSAAIATTSEDVEGANPSSEEDIAADSDVPAGVGPLVWAPSSGSRCRQQHGVRSCEGPRRVPMPSAQALERQQSLEIDAPRAIRAAMGSALPEAWVAAIPGETATDLRWPVHGGRLWRGYGMHSRLARTRSGTLRRLRRRHRHEGVDIGADPGTPILAANDGLVIYSDNGMRGYGNVVVLAHRDASITLYAHCSATYVAAGDLVGRGQVIAAVGATGLAHGPHLHFEWRVNGHTRDPLRHFVNRPSADRTEEPSIHDAMHEPLAPGSVAVEP
jgi:murein DD-endopeptidase MepM/ murein hydrolase activator NlpD